MYTGAQAPESLDVTINATSDFDPSTASLFAIDVWDPNGKQTTWTVTSVVAQTAAAVTLRHTFAQGEVALAGTYRLRITCTTPAGTRRSFTPRISAVPPTQ
jgi:hypothetical protein